MLLDQETLRFIFGLKLRGLRLERGLSLKELSKRTGLSPSYINEIEKGKKYPKSDKILSLAEALGEPYEDLISLKLKKELALVSQLLEKNVFSGMPFEIFGIPAATLFELLAERPKKMSALVGTLLELARVHGISVDDFFYATLRAYLDMHQNFFPGIEEKVETFCRDFEFVVPATPGEVISTLSTLLVEDFDLRVNVLDFSALDPELNQLQFFLKKDRRGKTVLNINSRLSEKEHAALLAREVGSQYMRIKARPQSSWVENLDSFEQLFNHYSASYFANALLIPRDRIVAELGNIFNSPVWRGHVLQQLIESYVAPAENVFQRMAQLIPRFFGLNHLFFLRFEFDSKTKNYEMLRELHLSALHTPHRVGGDEHYCRRWITTRLLPEAEGSGSAVGAQRSKFVSSDNEYLNLSYAFRDELEPHRYGCVTIGILLNQKTRETISFLEDASVPQKTVGETCERCPLKDCQERAAPERTELDPHRYERVRKLLDSFIVD